MCHLEKNNISQVVAAGKVGGAAVYANMGQGCYLRSVELDQITTSSKKKVLLSKTYFKCEIALNEAVFKIDTHSLHFMDFLSVKEISRKLLNKMYIGIF